MFSILGFWFAAPWLFAAGAAATSVPIIIHLLNKRKFRIVIWAAMEFLLAAQRRNARRLKFQRWLLLAMRVLALLILAAAIGQLVLENTAAAFLGSGQRGIVVIWDDSYSMGFQRNDAPTAFDNSKKLLVEWLGKLNSSDKVMLIQAHRGGVVAGNKPSPDRAGLEARVKATELSDAGTDLPAALDQAAAALKTMKQEGMQTREVLILTDFSNSSIHDPVRGVGAENRLQGLGGDRLKKAMDAVKAETTSTPQIKNLGTPEQSNLALTELRPKRPIVVAGQNATFEVSVMNATDKPAVDRLLTILVDGVVSQTVKVGRIEAGSPITMEVEVGVPTTGRHMVEARLQPDLLPTDDVRRVMLNVQREIPVLLVDGNPPSRDQLGSTQFLEVAYAKTGPTFSAKMITELELPTTTLAPFAVVVLSDTTAPRSQIVRDNLKKYVEDGGLLMIFPGDNTNAQNMNELLGEAGTKLLPATLGQPVKLVTAEELAKGIAFSASPQDMAHPVLQMIGKELQSGKDPGFKTVQTTQYLKLGIPADGSSEVVLRYANAAGTPGDPAIVMKGFGRGKVVLFASTADKRWNTFGPEPSFVPIIHELTYYAMSRDATGLSLRVGDKVNLPGDSGNPGSWGAPRGTRVSVSSEVVEGRPRLTSGPLQLAGPYSTPEGQTVVVVNPDPEEVDIRYVKPEAMAATLGVDPKDIGENPKFLDAKVAGQNKSAGSDIARNLLLAALAFFLIETLMARLFSVYH